jgi:hypothetical protein
LLAAAGLSALAGIVVVPSALGAASKAVVISDPSGDVAGPLDLTRVSLQRAADGRLRATMSFAAAVRSASLIARTGPPGSACLRIWTDSELDPTATRPDHLVCVTARSAKAFRGGVYDSSGPAPVKRLADASVTLATSGRSIVIRFTQSSIGRPKSLRFAAESTRPGCVAVSCIDVAPDGGAPQLLKLR